MTRQEIALGELRALSVDIGLMWAEYLGGSNTLGKAPTLETLGTIADLTQRYKDARTLYEAGDYLTCIALLTLPEETGK